MLPQEREIMDLRIYNGNSARNEIVCSLLTFKFSLLQKVEIFKFSQSLVGLNILDRSATGIVGKLTSNLGAAIIQLFWSFPTAEDLRLKITERFTGEGLSVSHKVCNEVR